MTNEQMVRKIRDGESRLLEKLIENNKGMIHKTAMRYIGYTENNKAVDYDDLYQSAVVGLIEAIPEWESTKGLFLTLAAFYMRNSIRRTLGIATSKRTVDNFPKVSLDAPVSDDLDVPLVETIADYYCADPAEEAVNSDVRHIVRTAVESLPESQYKAIRHWLYGGAPAGTDKERIAAKKALRKNKTLLGLWEEFRDPFRIITMKRYKSTMTSSVEMAVLFREEWIERINKVLMDSDGVYNQPEYISPRIAI